MNEYVVKLEVTVEASNEEEAARVFWELCHDGWWKGEEEIIKNEGE